MAPDSAAKLTASIDEDDLDEEPGEVIESAPPLKVGEERQINSSGLKKLLLKRGVGWETPELGDEVTVHYVGTLIDGTKFDSTRDNNKPLTFKLGKEQMVLGLQQSINTMKKGELAKFTVPPQLGYGDLGGNGVPQNCYIQFEVELISWITVVDICKDGGIIKRIIQEGENSAPPSDLDEVLVKYQVMLENDLLDVKTPDGGVEFYLKDGHFCPALSKVIKTMRRREKVNLVIQPQYAFGESGYDTKDGSSMIPPNCVLKIDLELVSYKSVIDVTGDFKVLKKILEEGQGIDAAKEGATVTVRYIAMLENGTLFERKGFDGEGPLEFITDEEQVIEGLDMSVATMKKGEKALLTINPEYGFGNVQVMRNLAIVPPNSLVIYEVEMVDFCKEKLPSEMSCPERIQTAEKKKEKGSLLFRNGKYQRAVQKYEKAVEFITEDGSLRDGDGNAMKTLRVSCWLNVADCNLKLKDFQQAIRLCSKVLDVEFYNIKALYRRAQAYMETYDLQLAEMDIKKALEADPQNREVKMIQKSLKELKAESNKRDAKLFENMFAPRTKDGYFFPRKKLKIGEVEGDQIDAEVKGDQIDAEVKGDQSHERVITLGSGVTPTTFRSDYRVCSSSSSTSNLQQTDATQHLREENMQLRQDMTQMQAIMDQQMEAMLAKMRAEADRQMTDFFASMPAEMRAEMRAEMDRKMADFFASMRAEMDHHMTDFFASMGHPPPPQLSIGL